MLKYLFAISHLAILAMAGHRASALANVTENQSTYLYVDAMLGSDGNAGAQSSPLRTLGAAVNKANHLNQKGTSVKVVLNAGVYREFINIGNFKTTSATLTLEAAVAGTAIISGSDVLTGWSDSGGIYSRGWTFDQTACRVPPKWPSAFAAVALHNEMIFVNGTPLTQVLSWSDLTPGTIFINNNYAVIHIDPPTGTDMATAVVEAAVRPATFTLVRRSNVVLRGLVFEHAADCINTTGANIYRSDNVLVDSVQAVWNNWGGLGIYSSNNITVRNSIGSYNGGIGFLVNKSQNVLFDFNESDHNNWRGAQAGFDDWAMGGTKMMYMRNTTVRDHFSYNNQGQGLWFDTDNKNITVTNATLSGNIRAALQIERD